MIQAVSRQCLPEKTHFRLLASQYEICVGKNGIGTGVSSITLVSTCPYESINARYSSLFVSCCHQAIRMKPGNIRNATLFENRKIYPKISTPANYEVGLAVSCRELW